MVSAMLGASGVAGAVDRLYSGKSVSKVVMQLGQLVPSASVSRL